MTLPVVFGAGRCFGTEGLSAVAVSISISILSPCPRWAPVDPCALQQRVKSGKSRQIVANDSGDAVRFLQGGESCGRVARAKLDGQPAVDLAGSPAAEAAATP